MSRDVDGTSEGEAGFIAFAGSKRIATGALGGVAVAAKQAQDRGEAGVLAFDAKSGAVVDLDLRGDDAAVRTRHAPPPAPPKRGRPKLGVVPREVTLLPRHWEWLSRQPGGASIALRKLVEAARKDGDLVTAARTRTEAAYRFMSAMAGDLPGFEDAARALFAGDRDGLARCSEVWPPDVRDQVFALLG